MRPFNLNAFSVPFLSICAQYSTAAVISSHSTTNVTSSVSPSSSLGTTTHGNSTSKPLINTLEPSQSSISTSAIQSFVSHANTPVGPSPSATFSSHINGGLSTITSSTSADLSAILGSSSSTIAISITTSTTLPPTDASTVLDGSGTTVVPPESATESSTQTFETTDTASLTSSQPVLISPVDTGTGNTPIPSHPSTNTTAFDDPTPTGSPVPPILVTTSAQPGSSQSHTTNIITSFNTTEIPTSVPTISNDPSTSLEITASVSLSSISSEFVNILPIITSWEKNPRPPLQTKAIDQVDSIKDEVEDLISEFGGDSSSSSSCPPLKLKKRGLVDNIFDLAGGAVDELVSGLSCISDEMEKLSQEIGLENTEAVRGIVSTLVSQSNNPPEDEDNNDSDNDTSSTSTPASTTTISSSSSESTSESSSSTSTSCTSDATVHHVTIVCEPTPVTSGDSTISTTIKCSPSTTITTSGCSVTETTTTVTSTPTPTSPQVCALGECGDSCGAGSGAGGGPVAISTSIDCASIPIVTVTELPSNTKGADSGLRRRDDGDGVLRLTKRIYNTNALIPDIETVDQKARQLALSRLITEGNGWLNHAPSATTGKWYPMTTEPFTAAGVKGLWGCTSLVIISKLGAYISHIYEDPVFLYYDNSNKKWEDTTDAVFQDASFGRLRDGREGVENGLAGLIGEEQDGTPSGLNAEREPQIFVITPFKNGDQGDLQYDARARWLGAQVASLIYGNTNTGFVGPIYRGYQRTDAARSGSDDEIYGRAIVEYAMLNEVREAYVPTSNEIGFMPYARWRLWAGGKYVVDNDFTFAQQPITNTNIRRGVETGDRREDDELKVVEGKNAKGAVGLRVRRQSMNDFFYAICPGYWDEITSATTTATATQSQTTTFVTTKTTSTSTSTPSSPSMSEPTVTSEPEPISTSTKSTLEPITATTKATASAVNSNPPGQPPGFTLPTTEPAATASPEPTIGEQRCWKSSLFSHKDVIPALVNQLAEMCIYGKITDDQMDFGPEDERLSWDNGAPSRAVGYVEISWVEGCEGPSQNPVFPAEGVNCKTLLVDNWESCESVNGGAGGYRTVGCLRYMYMPQLPSVWYPDWS